MSLQNKVAIVTGASSGIGAATAIKFVEEGAFVSIVGRNAEKLRNVTAKCAAVGNKPLVISAELTNDEDLRRIIDSTIKHFGKLDVLVNNAGIFDFDDILSETAMSSFDKMIATNLRPAVYLTHLAAPYLIETKGNIVNVSSVASIRIGLPRCFAYNTSKAGLDHFTRTIASELAPKGVRVNSVNPGIVRTDISEGLGVEKDQEDDFWNSFNKTAPLGKIAGSEEIADLILFIASDKGKSITGASFVTDNGTMVVSQIVK
ncbi:3-oxoacyl-[acyl-carrier-protein] reductase FabG-like [Anticarsia gemmatalis]|uniref:3-oxoacyl-[acyl-carrier-protein] reductase FabG-like n=1 Tax=Anticarsia gemmatalis TaxID=129554 RepID=UPI003F76EC59